MPAAANRAETTIQQLKQNLEVLVKSNGVLVSVGQPSHNPALLVVTNTLLKEVGLAPADNSQRHVRQRMCLNRVSPLLWLDYESNNRHAAG